MRYDLIDMKSFGLIRSLQTRLKQCTVSIPIDFDGLKFLSLRYFNICSFINLVNLASRSRLGDFVYQGATALSLTELLLYH